MANYRDKRQPISETQIRLIAEDIVKGLLKKMEEKENGSFVHRHEIMGCLQEEWHELIEASHGRDNNRMWSELRDLAMGVIFSMASLTTLDPTRR